MADSIPHPSYTSRSPQAAGLAMATRLPAKAKIPVEATSVLPPSFKTNS